MTLGNLGPLLNVIDIGMKVSFCDKGLKRETIYQMIGGKSNLQERLR
jgi:hypothetical protein